MLNELRDIAETHQWTKDKAILIAAEEKHGMTSPEMFKALLKVYTGESLHNSFGAKLLAGKYESIQTYLTAYIDNLNRHGLTYSYQKTDKPLYRAVDPLEKYSDKDYEVNSIGQWPLF